MLKRLKITFIIISLLTAIVHLVHALTFDRIIEYKEITFYSSRWPSQSEGYLIGFITDIHRMSKESLEIVADELNLRNIDLLLLGGDFWFSDEHYQGSLAALSKVKTTDGIFGVEGNHDDYVRLFAAMEAKGIIPLSNSGRQIKDGFYLAGVADLWNRSPSISKAIAEACDNDFVLLLAHNPDVAMKQDTAEVDLILSGHTHGGQITFLGLWAPYFTFRNSISEYGQRFVSGWADSKDATPVYVSNGIGEYLPRIFARPQVILLTIKTYK